MRVHTVCVESFFCDHDVQKIYAKRYENWELLFVAGSSMQCQKYKIEEKAHSRVISGFKKEIKRNSNCTIVKNVNTSN